MGKIKTHYTNWDNKTMWHEHVQQTEERRKDNRVADCVIFVLICLCLLLGSTLV
jgi:hypothetical protein